MKKAFTLYISALLTISLAACSTGAATKSADSLLNDSAAAASSEITTASVKETNVVASSADLAADTHDSADDYTWDASTEISITLNGDSITASDDSVKVSGGTAIISAAGNYRLSGTLTDGQILVNTTDEGTVRIILDGVTLNNSTSSAINIEDAKKVVIVLADGSQNQVSDATTYVQTSAEEDEPNAAIFSTADLTICGNGALTVNANSNDGISSKDGLIIASGVITVNSVDDGIRGKDYVVVKGGILTLQVDGDGLKSDNEEDAGKGFIDIEAGTIKITSAGDAIQAVTDVLITDGQFILTTGGGSGAQLDENASAKAVKGTVSVTINGGSFAINSADDSIHTNGDMVISGGSYNIASGDDAFHADLSLTINDGVFNVTTCYEGIESDLITVNNGTIYLTASDDAFNATNGSGSAGNMGGPGGGNMPSGGGMPNDGGGMPGGGGPGGGGGGRRSTTFGSTSTETAADSAIVTDATAADTTATANPYIYINGGYIVVNAGGDGLDSNYSIAMTGGTVIVNGPTNSANGALDYMGTFTITGGTLIAVGSSGMAQSPDNSSSQNSVLVNFTSAQEAGTIIHIESGDGTDVLTYKTTKKFQSIAFSSAQLVTGSTYTISLGGTSTGTSTDNVYSGGAYSGGTEYGSFTISSVSTSLGGRGNFK